MSFILLGILNSQAAAAGEAGAYELIESNILTNNATQTVTFASIPQDFKHLQVRAVIMSNQSGFDTDVLQLRMNGVTTASYSRHRLQGTGSQVNHQGQSGQTFIRLDQIITSKTNNFRPTPLIVDVLDYASSAKNTTIRSLSGSPETYTRIMTMESGAFHSTAAVTSLSFGFELTGSQFVAGSRLSIYGIRG